MSNDREKRIAKRAEEIRRQEGDPRGQDSDPSSPNANSEAVQANQAMDAAFSGERDPDDKGKLAAERAAAGVRLQSTDRVEHVAGAGDDATPSDRR